MLALTTRCFSPRGSVAELCAAAAELGFRSILVANHDVAPRPGPVERAAASVGVRVCALRAGCLEARTTTRRACEELGSLDEGRRERAVRALHDHAAFAKSLHCQTVVLDGGAAEGPSIDARVQHALGVVDRGEPAAELLEEIRMLVSKNRERHLERLARSLHAVVHGHPEMVFALLPAARPHELLDASALLDVLADVKSDRLRVWFDAGASRAGERLGCEPSVRLLSQIAPRIAGLFLHDVHGLREHLPPGQGDVDWKLVKDHAPRAAIRALDLEVGSGAVAVRESARILGTLGLD
jgi:sugar phosphate isomerase/epimerase